MVRSTGLKNRARAIETVMNIGKEKDLKRDIEKTSWGSQLLNIAETRSERDDALLRCGVYGCGIWWCEHHDISTPYGDMNPCTG